MNIAEQIIHECFGESIQKVYPYFVYQQINAPYPVFHFFPNKVLHDKANCVYYAKAWCKHSFDHPFRKSLVPLENDRVRTIENEVIEIIHIVTA